ncbi:MAG: RHS repeat-associated core domain-containing protein, partial [Planctomycetota bacterium]
VYVPHTPDPANNFATKKTIVNDRVGNVEELYYEVFNRCVIRQEYTGRANPLIATTDTTNLPIDQLRMFDPPLIETRYEYNHDALPIRVLYPNDNEELFSYDSSNPSPRSRGNLLQHCRQPGPLGGDQPQICETFEYDPVINNDTNSVTRYYDGRSHPATYQYDANGNRTQTTHRIPSIVEDFQYNAFGQMTIHIHPDNGSGSRRQDQYIYYPPVPITPQYGYLQNKIIDAANLALTTTYEYDAVGNITRVIDPLLNDTIYDVNQLDQVVQTTTRDVAPPANIRYTRDIIYDANDNVVQVDIENRDDQGVLQPNTHFTTTLQYDILDYLTFKTEEVDPIQGIVTEYQYDANRNRTLVRYGEATSGSQPNNTVRSLYDERDLLFREVRAETDPDQSTTQYDYDGNRNVVQTSHGLESVPHVTTFTYDGYNRLITTLDPMGNITTSHYDANDNIVSTQRDGETIDVPGSTNNVRLSETTFTYDDMDRLTRSDVEFFDTATQTPIDDGKATTRIFYSDNSQVVLIIDDNNHQTTATYDTANRRSTVTDAKSNTTTYVYDANSNVVTVNEVDKSDLPNPDESFTTTFTYDGLDRLTSTVDNVGNTTNYGYDSRGNNTVLTDALSNETRYTYDGLSRLTTTIRDLDGDGADGDGTDITTTQTWDDTSRLVSQIDDNSNTTTYAYDALNRLVQTDLADCTTETYDYDVHDNVTILTDAIGSVITSTYDMLKRLTDKIIAPGPGVSSDITFETYEYDGLSRSVHAEDDDSLVTRSYDSLSRIRSEIQNGHTITGVYDGVGNQLTNTYPGGRVVTYAYDALDRITTATSGATTIATYKYVGPNRVARRDYGNGTRTDLTYDGISGIMNPAGDSGVKQVIRTAHSVISSGAVIDDRDYLWDPTQNKKQRRDTRLTGPRMTHDYEYDPIDRLVQTTVKDSVPTTVRQTNYTLDSVGNRTTVLGIPDPGTYTMDNTLCEPGDAQMNQYSVTSFDNREYDQNGNLATIDAGLPTQRVMAYDYRDQLVMRDDTTVGGTVTHYAYDALGRRIAKQISAGTPPVVISETHYLYDGSRAIEEQDGGGTTQATYVYGNYIDEVLNMKRGGNDYYYHTDDLYNIMAVTDGTGTVVERYEYQDYGEPEFSDGSGTPIVSTAIGNPLLFNARRYDQESGLYYYRTRYLDPKAGRFTARDTIGIWGDSANLGNGTAYAGNNPWTNLDPFGLANCKCSMSRCTCGCKRGRSGQSEILALDLTSHGPGGGGGGPILVTAPDGPMETREHYLLGRQLGQPNSGVRKTNPDQNGDRILDGWAASGASGGGGGGGLMGYRNDAEDVSDGNYYFIQGSGGGGNLSFVGHELLASWTSTGGGGGGGLKGKRFFHGMLLTEDDLELSSGGIDSKYEQNGDVYLLMGSSSGNRLKKMAGSMRIAGGGGGGGGGILSDLVDDRRWRSLMTGSGAVGPVSSLIPTTAGNPSLLSGSSIRHVRGGVGQGRLKVTYPWAESIRAGSHFGPIPYPNMNVSSIKKTMQIQVVTGPKHDTAKSAIRNVK